MLRPLELHDPFSSEHERASSMIRLLEFDSRLQELQAATLLSDEDLHHSSVWTQLSGMEIAPGESIEGRLRRWSAEFADDIAMIRQARNRVVHSTWVSDQDLRAAVWLAGELLGQITDGATGGESESS